MRHLAEDNQIHSHSDVDECVLAFSDEGHEAGTREEVRPPFSRITQSDGDTFPCRYATTITSLSVTDSADASPSDEDGHLPQLHQDHEHSAAHWQAEGATKPTRRVVTLYELGSSAGREQGALSDSITEFWDAAGYQAAFAEFDATLVYERTATQEILVAAKTTPERLLDTLRRVAWLIGRQLLIAFVMATFFLGLLVGMRFACKESRKQARPWVLIDLARRAIESLVYALNASQMVEGLNIRRVILRIRRAWMIFAVGPTLGFTVTLWYHLATIPVWLRRVLAILSWGLSCSLLPWLFFYDAARTMRLQRKREYASQMAVLYTLVLGWGLILMSVILPSDVGPTSDAERLRVASRMEHFSSKILNTFLIAIYDLVSDVAQPYGVIVCALFKRWFMTKFLRRKACTMPSPGCLDGMSMSTALACLAIGPRYTRALADQIKLYGLVESFVLILTNMVEGLKREAHSPSSAALVERFLGLLVLVMIEGLVEALLITILVRSSNLPILRSEGEAGVVRLRILLLFENALTAILVLFIHIYQSYGRAANREEFENISPSELCPLSSPIW
ncbi:unnamed protein product [Vitrella brassicaformis CCMP3155]|uniref:Transmembrane protein n=1 Tax=Vitrella brassicaformis (strain CCMP3155) TaxID=1169540 RepID=A0A0G4ETW7_VITBC|nr:unnamed protein product [Vitrella brassicaformis CCMP3155]|eukprot:CEM01824.1 unnamed protein product [Vitrella brassicaformis CCMP3155]